MSCFAHTSLLLHIPSSFAVPHTACSNGELAWGLHSFVYDADQYGQSSSTLRRLAKDHKSLHADLPPNFLFPPSSASDAIPDDLTRLTILLAGPQGTPYSKGVWKLQIKIPDDYPRSPPKAAFRTRIWHPNVEESTGSVCVETLKRDWDPKLTLRDVLIVSSTKQLLRQVTAQ